MNNKPFRGHVPRIDIICDYYEDHSSFSKTFAITFYVKENKSQMDQIKNHEQSQI